MTEDPLIQICTNKIKNRIVFKIKNGYKLELLTAKTMKLSGSTKKDVDSDRNSDILPKNRICWSCFSTLNLFKNDYQHTSKVLFSFAPNKPFAQLINMVKN